MKTILIFLVTLSSFTLANTEQNDIKIKATFDSHEDGTYFFTDEKGKSYEFKVIETEALEKYDLTEDNYLGRTFDVTYTTDTDIDDSDEEYEIYVITDLELLE